MSIETTDILEILREETRLATGCTEVAAAALVCAKAAALLEKPVDHLELTVSANVYKNGALVSVPGTGLRGLAAAGSLGAAIADPDSGLGILGRAGPAELDRAGILMATGIPVSIDHSAQESVYLRADATNGKDHAWAVIAGSHDSFVETGANGETLSRQDRDGAAAEACDILRGVPLMEILDLVAAAPLDELGFLLDAAQVNRDAAATDLLDPEARLGTALEREGCPNQEMADASIRARALAAAASEARMLGRNVPVAAISGSGNHGIATFLGVSGVADRLGSSREERARALAISAAVTVFIKAHTGRLTAYCGCSIAPATGVAAAVVKLMGGSDAAMIQAMQSVIGTFAGMLCDGAKLSCAFKIATVVGTAIELAELAVQGAYVPFGEGIVGETIEQSVMNLGRLNAEGMRETERVVLDIVGTDGGKGR